jgi:hypothetical protein
MHEHEKHHRDIERRLRHMEARQGGKSDEPNAEGFIYQVTTAAIAAGAAAALPLQIDALSDFDLLQLVGYAEVAGGAFPQADNLQPQLKIQITDGAENRQLFSSDLPWGAVVGTSKLPFIFPRPRRFIANQSLTVTVTSFAAVAYNNVFLGLIGAKIYPDDRRT